MTDRTVGSYVVRVTVHAGAWRIVVTDVRSGEAWTCASFAELAQRLEHQSHTRPAA